MDKDKKTKKEKTYTYPEVLTTFFPNAEDRTLYREDFVLTTDNFYDILTKVTKSKQPTLKMKETSV
jgi:hypothetical protein